MRTEHQDDQRSLYILQRRDWDKAPFTVIANELGEAKRDVKAAYQVITRELAESEAA